MYYFLLFKKKYPVDFDEELKIGDVRYDNMTKITIKVQLFWRLPYETFAQKWTVYELSAIQKRLFFEKSPFLFFY